DADPRVSLRLRRHVVAADLSRGLLCVRRNRSRERADRQRSLAPLFPDAWRAVGADGGLAFCRTQPRGAAFRRRPCTGPTGGLVLAPAERSAARLAHQSGGLGVPSSNLGAPTNKIN